MQQTIIQDAPRFPWVSHDSSATPSGTRSPRLVGPATAQTAIPALSISHINGYVVIGPPRVETAELRPQPLSSRETEVLALVAEGNGNKEIGVVLHISERTVKNHLTGIMTKLRASDRTHAVVTAVRLGWLAI